MKYSNSRAQNIFTNAIEAAQGGASKEQTTYYIRAKLQSTLGLSDYQAQLYAQNFTRILWAIEGFEKMSMVQVTNIHNLMYANEQRVGA